MSNSSEVIAGLIAYFNATSWPIHIDEKKLWDRYSLATDKAWPGHSIVEIERHRPILGTTYTRGLPMGAYETYYMRYAVPIAGGVVQELPDRSVELCIDIGAVVEEHLSAERFDLSIEAIDEHSYRISENVCNDEAIIRTLEDAKQFTLSMAEGFEDQFSEQMAMDFTSERQLQRIEVNCHIDAYKIEIAEGLICKAEEAWAKREEWEA